MSTYWWVIGPYFDILKSSFSGILSPLFEFVVEVIVDRLDWWPDPPVYPLFLQQKLEKL